MPQSTPERRARWESLEKARDYLVARGYVLTEEWTWVNIGREPTDEESDAMLYLIEEWDFGGLW